MVPQDTLLIATLDLEGCRRQGDNLAIVEFLQDEEVEQFLSHLFEVMKSSMEADGNLSPYLDFLASDGSCFRAVDKISLALLNPLSRGGLETGSKKPALILSIALNDVDRFRDSFPRLLGMFKLSPQMESLAQGFKVGKIALPPGEEAFQALYYSFTESHLFLGSDEASFLQLLKTLPQEEAPGSLAGADAYARLKSRMLSEKAGFFCAVNMKAVLARHKLERKQDEGGGKPAWLPEEIQWLAMSSVIDNRLIVDDLRIICSKGEGLFNLVQDISAEPVARFSIPEAADLFFLLQIDPTRLFTQVQKAVALAAPEKLPAFESGLTHMSRWFGMKIQDVLATFSGGFAGYLIMPKYGVMPNVILSTRVAKESNFDLLVEKVSDFAKAYGCKTNPVKLRQGSKAYYFSFPGNPVPVSPAFAVLDENLLVAETVTSLKKTLSWSMKAEMTGENLLETPAYLQTLAVASAGRKQDDLLGVFYLNAGRLLETVYNSLIPLAGIPVQEAGLNLDLGMLPTGDVFQKCFGPSVLVMDGYEEGENFIISFRSASPLCVTPLFLASSFVGAAAQVPPPPREITITAAVDEKQDTGSQHPSQDASFLGVYLNPEDTRDAGISITGVVEDSPAEAVGLASGDLLVNIEFEPVRNLQEMQRILRNYKPGEEISILIMRKGKKLPFTLVLARLGDFVN